MLNKFDLTGRTAIITGGAGLLGIQHATALLACGATVILTDIGKENLLTAQGLLGEFPPQRIFVHEMDVTDADSIKTVLEFVLYLGLRPDILINNAAIDPKVKDNEGIIESSRLENFPLAQWNLQLSVGLTGAFLCCQVFGTAMHKDGKGGVILNISSDLSVFAPDQRLYRKDGVAEDMQPVKPVTYSVIKTALIGLTRYMAAYWSGGGIRCNALSPGGVYNNQGEAFVRKLTSLIPLGRMAAKDEYQAAVQFLCSDASAYMNGQNIVMDGGRSIL